MECRLNVRAADNIVPVLNRIIFFLIAASAAGCFSGSKSSSVTVESANGVWTGFPSEGTVSFKGIPYAAPVDGDRRWMPPVPASSLAGGFTAKAWGNPCPHLNELLPDKRKPSDFVGDGDCLNLNIWVPDAAFADRASQKIPVMVFIHGGAFEIGFSGWKPVVLLYEGQRLAKAGPVVVVSINYRVGVLGFFQHPVINAAAGGHTNPGMLDQIEALRWVQNNINSFGGDPANVTVFGESAGGISICNLLTAPSAKGLFHKAIIQSGSCMVQSREKADETAEKLLAKLGCQDNKTPAQQAACLHSKTAKEIVLAQPMSTTLFRGEFSMLPIAPILDGVMFTESPDDVIRKSQHSQVPVLIGSNAREIPAWMQVDSKDSWENYIRSISTRLSPEAGEQVRKLYEERNRGNYKDLIAELKSDMSFTCRARYFADLLAQHQKQPVWLYLFEKSLDPIESFTDRVHGSFHGMELLYVFQHIPAFKLPGVTGLLAQHQDLQERIGNLWTGFAKSGALPEGELWQEWKPYGEGRVAGVLGDFYGTLDDPRKEKCELLERYLLADGAVGILR